MTTQTYEDNNMDDVFDLFNYIEEKNYSFIYLKKEEQIDGIIYYVNQYFDYRLYLNAPEHTEFITNVVNNCHTALDSIHNNDNRHGESEWSLLQELFETQTIEMIGSVIKDFYEYHKI
jgi:hypothetical protein